MVDIHGYQEKDEGMVKVCRCSLPWKYLCKENLTDSLQQQEQVDSKKER